MIFANLSSRMSSSSPRTPALKNTCLAKVGESENNSLTYHFYELFSFFQLLGIITFGQHSCLRVSLVNIIGYSYICIYLTSSNSVGCFLELHGIQEHFRSFLAINKSTSNGSWCQNLVSELKDRQTKIRAFQFTKF